MVGDILDLDDYEVEYAYTLFEFRVLLDHYVVEYKHILENDHCKVVECDITVLQIQFESVLQINDTDSFDYVCHILQYHAGIETSAISYLQI